LQKAFVRHLATNPLEQQRQPPSLAMNYAAQIVNSFPPAEITHNCTQVSGFTLGQETKSATWLQIQNTEFDQLSHKISSVYTIMQ